MGEECDFWGDCVMPRTKTVPYDWHAAFQDVEAENLRLREEQEATDTQLGLLDQVQRELGEAKIENQRLRQRVEEFEAHCREATFAVSEQSLPVDRITLARRWEWLQANRNLLEQTKEQGE
jgi:hypothetical protein